MEIKRNYQRGPWEITNMGTNRIHFNLKLVSWEELTKPQKSVHATIFAMSVQIQMTAQVSLKLYFSLVGTRKQFRYGNTFFLFVCKIYIRECTQILHVTWTRRKKNKKWKQYNYILANLHTNNISLSGTQSKSCINHRI